MYKIMKFIIEKSVLNESLSTLIIVCAKKNINNPILQNIKLEAVNNQLILTATDLDTTIKNKITLNIEKQGSTTVPAQMLFDIVKKVNEGAEISIEHKVEDNIVLISSGKSKFKLPCLSSEEFPYFEDVEMENEIMINTQGFIKIIDKTRFAISTDESRYYLMGLYFHTKEIDGMNYIAGATTDGHKLSFTKVPISEAKIFNGILIPKKTLGEIRKLLDCNEEEILVAFSKTKIKIQTSKTTLISKLIDAEFPEYDRVIPYNNTKIATINKKDFISALNRVSIIAEEKSKGVSFTFANNTLTLIASTEDGSYANEDVQIEYNAEEITIGFNAKYILEIISQIESDLIQIKLETSNTPSMVVGTEELDNIFVIMSMKI